MAEEVPFDTLLVGAAECDCLICRTTRRRTGDLTTRETMTEAERAQRVKELKEEAKEADERAEELLRQFLSPSQLEEWENKFFTVQGKRYRWSLGEEIQVTYANGWKGKPEQSFICIVPAMGSFFAERVPRADFLLGLKLAIENDEAAVCRLGLPNLRTHWPYGPC